MQREPQCELCSESGTVRVTEVVGRKTVERNYCKRHAPAYGGFSEAAWDEFVDRLAARVKENGRMPPVAEFLQYGEVGSFATRWCQKGTEESGRVLETIRASVRDRLAS